MSGENLRGVYERLADTMVGYLYERHGKQRHIRRVASWIGFLVTAIDQLPARNVRRSSLRQIAFDYRERHFKLRYGHFIGRRGGIELLEFYPTEQGQPDGNTVLEI